MPVPSACQTVACYGGDVLTRGDSSTLLLAVWKLKLAAPRSHQGYGVDVLDRDEFKPEDGAKKGGESRPVNSCGCLLSSRCVWSGA